MRRILVRCIATLLVVAAVLSVEAQETTDSYEQPPSRKAAKKAPPPSGAPPYMECSGEGPKWSVQFVSWGARYLGSVNQPDQDFPGGFFWIADEKAWLWQMSSGSGLSAKIRKAECTRTRREADLALRRGGLFAEWRHTRRLLPQIEGGGRSGCAAKSASRQRFAQVTAGAASCACPAVERRLMEASSSSM